MSVSQICAEHRAGGVVALQNYRAIVAIEPSPPQELPSPIGILLAPITRIWRHAFFIVVLNGGLASLLIRRPPWLIWPYTLLTLQIFNRHRRGAWRLWVEEGRVDWISASVTTGAPVLLCALWLDERRRRGAETAGTARL